MALYAFDGTWKDADKQPENESTNVHRFRCLYSAAGDEKVFYWSGSGSRFGKVGHFLGGFFGLGAKWRVNQALGRVYEQFGSGDEVIDIIGFSRGAATAAMFALMLNRQGVRAPKKIRLIGFDVTTFMQSSIMTEEPRIRFLGLFDTVFSTSDLHGPVQFQNPKRTIFKNFKLPTNVGAAYHAMAIHERTPGFEVARIDNAYEVWFPGVHGDVGGGENDRRVTTTSLRWMIAKAKSQGLPVDTKNTLAKFEPALPEVAKKKTSLRRYIKKGDRIHECAVGLPIGVDINTLIVEKTDVAHFRD